MNAWRSDGQILYETVINRPPLWGDLTFDEQRKWHDAAESLLSEWSKANILVALLKRETDCGVEIF